MVMSADISRRRIGATERFTKRILPGAGKRASQF